MPKKYTIEISGFPPMEIYEQDRILIPELSVSIQITRDGALEVANNRVGGLVLVPTASNRVEIRNGN
jgi:hypothetical protein